MDTSNMDTSNADILNRNNPVGVIEEYNKKGLGYASYGLDNKGYYLSVDPYGTSGFGKMELNFDETRSAFNAIKIFGLNVTNWNFDVAKDTLKRARKDKLSGGKLTFSFVDTFENFGKPLSDECIFNMVDTLKNNYDEMDRFEAILLLKDLYPNYELKDIKKAADIAYGNN